MEHNNHFSKNNTVLFKHNKVLWWGVGVYKKPKNRSKNYPKPKNRDGIQSKPKTAYKTFQSKIYTSQFS